MDGLETSKSNTGSGRPSKISAVAGYLHVLLHLYECTGHHAPKIQMRGNQATNCTRASKLQKADVICGDPAKSKAVKKINSGPVLPKNIGLPYSL